MKDEKKSWEEVITFDQLLINGQGAMPTKPNLPILPTIKEGMPTMGHPFSEEEYKNGTAALKNNKTAD